MNKTLLCAALAGVMGAAVAAHAADTAAPATDGAKADAAAAKNGCKGKDHNSCKGKMKNGCEGKNSCKDNEGKDKNSCKDKNTCKGADKK